MLKMKNVSFSYDEEKIVINNFNLSVNNGEIICIHGESGKGKSTILKLICGLLKADNGEIIMPENTKIGYVSQTNDLFNWYTARKNIEIVSPRENISELFEKFGLQSAEQLLPSQLSGGMARRVCIIRAVSVKPDILVLDEPFSGIDKSQKSNIIEFLKKKFADKIIIFTTHEDEEIESFDARIVEI